MSQQLPFNEIERVNLVNDIKGKYQEHSKFYENFTSLVASSFKVGQRWFSFSLFCNNGCFPIVPNCRTDISQC
jgi:hypothetical protein